MLPPRAILRSCQSVRLAGFCAALLLAHAPVASATDYYLDVNGATPGSGVVNGGVYAASGNVWSAGPYASDGTATPGALPSRQGFVFSSGVDAIGDSYEVTGSFGQVSGGIEVEEGNLTLSGGGAFYAGGQTVRTTGAGTSLTFKTATWDFYANTVTFEAASGCPITLNSIATSSGRNGGLTKTGPGLLTITGDATARGQVATVNDGELRLQTANALFNASYPPPGKTYTVTVNSGGTIELIGGLNYANNPITISGAGYNGLGALRSYSGANSFGQTITLAANARVAADAGASLTLNPTTGDAATGAFTLTLGGEGSVTVSRPLTLLTGLVKDGGGAVTFSVSHPFTGPTTVSAGTLIFTESGGVLGGVGGPIAINANLQITNAAAQSLPNVLSGASSGVLTKLGAGTLTLTAASPFAGATTITAGRLALASAASLDAAATITVQSGAFFDVSAVTGYTLKSGQTLAGTGTVTGAVTCQSGSQISPGAAAAPGTLTFAQPLAFAGGVTASFDLPTTPAGSGDQLAVSGNLTLAGTNTIRVNFTTLANGTYPLIRTSGGIVTGTVSSLQLAGFVPGAQVASLQLAPGGNGIDLVVSANPYTARNLTWFGDGAANVWDASATANWRVGASPVTFTTTDKITFDASGSVNSSVTLSGPLAPGSVTVNSASNYTFTGGGSLIGAMTLTKSGAGRLILTGDHAFTGGTVLSAGIIEARSGSSLGAGAVANAATLLFAPASSLTFANIITGAGALTQTSGATTLSGANTFTGPVSITGGTLRLGHVSALGATSGATTVSPSASLDLNGLALGAEPVTLAGGSLTNSSTAPASLAGPVTVSADSSITGSNAFTLGGAIDGSFTLTKSGSHVLTLGGASTRSGALSVTEGALLVTGNAGPGPVNISATATIGGSGTVGGNLTVAGAIDFGSSVATLTTTGNLTLQPTATTRLKIVKTAGGATADRLAVGGVFAPNGPLTVAVSGLPLAAGDTVQLFSAGSVSGAFTSVNLPYLYSDLIWDSSALAATGVLRVIALPAVSTQAQRRDWLLTRAAESPGAIDGSVMAAAYFARGDIAQGRALALSTSRSVLAGALGGAVQVDLFDYWPALDLAIRYGQYLDDETKANIKQVVTTFTQYKDTNTANLQTLGSTVRYLGGELYGEDAFTSLGITNYWRTNDISGKQFLLGQFASRATSGYPEFASRPYYWKDALPFLSIGQLSQDPAMRLAATMSFESAMAQNAGYWMRGHLGMPTGRSYPDVLNQFPVTSLGMLWFYFGGEIPAINTESAVFTAVMNAPVSDIITLAGSDRSAGFRSRSYIGNIHQDSWNDRDYALFSDGPISYGNFQVYPNGVAWCEPDLSRYSFLWVAKPWRDDSGINSSNPHGRSTGSYKEAQSRDAVAYIYNIPATGDAFPYALGYVPGGYRAAINDAATSGNLFLHYGTVLIAIRSENTFTWNPASGIAFPAATPASGDSEFHITGTLFAVAIETACPADYPGATPADQLAAFRADILAKTTLSHLNGAATPTALYTSRRGDTIQVALSKVPSTRPIAINGLPTNYNIWPMLENPWMYQRVNDPLLTLRAPGRRELLDFTTFTRSFQTAPTATAPATPPAAVIGQTCDIDLAPLAQPPAGSSAPLVFNVSQPSLGSVALLADGHTARFTPAAGPSGPGSFNFTARAAGVDPAQLVFLYDYEAPEDLADNTITDRSGHRLDATLGSIGAPVRSLVATTPAALGAASAQAISFTEGGNTASRLTNALSVTEHDLSDADWTFSTWVNRTTRTTDDLLLYLGSGDGGGGTGDELELYFPANSDTLRLRHYNTANTVDLDLSTPATATTGAWHHVAVSFTRTGLNTGVVRLYLNGVLAATSAPVTWALNQSSALVLGGCATTTTAASVRYLNGRLDDTALFNRVFSDAETAQLATRSVAQFTGLPATATVNLTVRTPIEQWRNTNFNTTANTGVSANLADPDNDGLPNLLEYAMMSNPQMPNPSSGLTLTASSGDDRLTLAFQRRADDSTLTYSVEASNDLTAWTPVATMEAGGTVWTGGATVTETGSPAAPQVSVKDVLPMTGQTRRFLRLRVKSPN